MAKVYLKKEGCAKKYFCRNEHGTYCYFIDRDCTKYDCTENNIVYIEVKYEN